MDQPPFHYQPRCSSPECEGVASYKIAAPWAYGNMKELKNYGLFCEAHLDRTAREAKERANKLDLAEGETMGPVGVYQILPGIRDAELSRVE